MLYSHSECMIACVGSKAFCEVGLAQASRPVELQID